MDVVRNVQTSKCKVSHDNGSIFLLISVRSHLLLTFFILWPSMLWGHSNCLKANSYLPKFGLKNTLLQKCFWWFLEKKQFSHGLHQNEYSAQTLLKYSILIFMVSPELYSITDSPSDFLNANANRHLHLRNEDEESEH